MGGMAMPSDKYINLTLGANGSTYTAPANGYFCINALSASNSQAEVTFDNRGPNGDTHFSSTSRTYASNQYLQTNIEAKKGDRVYLFYGNIKTPQHYFRFIYAKGSESEIE